MVIDAACLTICVLALDFCFCHGPAITENINVRFGVAVVRLAHRLNISLHALPDYG